MFPDPHSAILKVIITGCAYAHLHPIRLDRAALEVFFLRAFPRVPPLAHLRLQPLPSRTSRYRLRLRAPDVPA